jgi:hypothetical protein
MSLVKRDSFSQSLFQFVWYKRAHLDNPAMPLATEFGRQVINGTLCPIMMSLPSKLDVQNA